MREYCTICDKEYELDYPYQRRQRRSDLCPSCDIFNEGYIAAETHATIDDFEKISGYVLRDSGIKEWTSGYRSWAAMNPELAKARAKAERKDRVKRFSNRWRNQG